MHKTLLALAIAGFAFSGYLSGVKFFSGNCAFNEGCPFFLGYPACYFGFGMFTLITLFATLLYFKKWDTRQTINSLLFVTLLGILFAGYFTFQELPVLFSQGLQAYLLGLPTCALGLIFYILVAIVAWKIRTVQSEDTVDQTPQVAH